MIITKVVEDPTVGEYTVIINRSNNTVTTIIDVNIFMYSFDKDELITEILRVAPDETIESFILDYILGDEDLTNFYFKLIKHI